MIGSVKLPAQPRTPRGTTNGEENEPADLRYGKTDPDLLFAGAARGVQHGHHARVQPRGHLFHRENGQRPAGCGGIPVRAAVHDADGDRQHLRAGRQLADLASARRGRPGERRAGQLLLLLSCDPRRDRAGRAAAPAAPSDPRASGRERGDLSIRGIVLPGHRRRRACRHPGLHPFQSDPERGPVRAVDDRNGVGFPAEHRPRPHFHQRSGLGRGRRGLCDRARLSAVGHALPVLRAEKEHGAFGQASG